jgi:hypothetical protein
MKLDRYMVNLFFEIKRNLPLAQQREMLVSNPNIGNVMTKLYQTTQDENVKLLTGVFLERAGKEWVKKANRKIPATEVLTKLFEKASSLTQDKSMKEIPKKKAKRIYRGQVVED